MLNIINLYIYLYIYLLIFLDCCKSNNIICNNITREDCIFLKYKVYCDSDLFFGKDLIPIIFLTNNKFIMNGTICFI